MTISILRTLIWPAAWLLLVILVAGSEASGDVVREELEVEPSGQLIVDVQRGGVFVETHAAVGASAPILTVEVRHSGFGPNLSVDIDQEGDTVRVAVKGVPLLRWFPPFWWNSVRVDISVPERFDVEVATRGGPVEIDGVEGRVHARTRGGELVFTDIHGEIDGRTRGGAVEVDTCHGDVDVETLGGPIRIENVVGDVIAKSVGGRVDAREVDGDLVATTLGGSVEATRISGQVTASTRGGGIRARFSGRPAGEMEAHGGSIDVWFAEGEGADLEARAYGGRVEVEHESVAGAWHGRDHGRSEVSASLNGGGEVLRLRSLGGSIHVHEVAAR